MAISFSVTPNIYPIVPLLETWKMTPVFDVSLKFSSRVSTPPALAISSFRFDSSMSIHTNSMCVALAAP